MIEVWRGLAVPRRDALDMDRLIAGERLSPNRHRWWATKRGIAEAYATTGNGVPVILRAELVLRVGKDEWPTTPCLPALPTDAVLYLREAIWL